MMRKSFPVLKLTFMVYWCLLVHPMFAQPVNASQKAVFLEVAGSGGLGSLNFEKVFRERLATTLTWRAGLSFLPIDSNNGVALIFPVTVNALIGRQAHRLETGLGQGFTVTTKGGVFALTLATFGYRYQAPEKRHFYRITYTPLISYLFDFQVQHWGGISVGYHLK